MSFYEHQMLQMMQTMRGHIVLLETMMGTIVSLLGSILVAVLFL